MLGAEEPHCARRTPEVRQPVSSMFSVCEARSCLSRSSWGSASAVAILVRIASTAPALIVRRTALPRAPRHLGGRRGCVPRASLRPRADAPRRSFRHPSGSSARRRRPQERAPRTRIRRRRVMSPRPTERLRDTRGFRGFRWVWDGDQRSSSQTSRHYTPTVGGFFRRHVEVFLALVADATCSASSTSTRSQHDRVFSAPSRARTQRPILGSALRLFRRAAGRLGLRLGQRKTSVPFAQPASSYLSALDTAASSPIDADKKQKAPSQQPPRDGDLAWIGPSFLRVRTKLCGELDTEPGSLKTR